jgi:hypothetical protein
MKDQSDVGLLAQWEIAPYPSDYMKAFASSNISISHSHGTSYEVISLSKGAV